MKLRSLISMGLLLAGMLFLLTSSGYGSEKAIKKSRNRSALVQPLVKHVVPAINGIIKYEEVFADSTALSQWIILNEDQSTFLGTPSVGKFVSILEFVTGDVVNAEAPGTFFWASNFSNAFGKLLDEWLISPQLPVVETGDTLCFYGGSPGEADHDSVQVRLAVSDPHDTSTAFVYNLGRFKMDGPTGGWTLYKAGLDIPEAIGKPIWIALRYWHTDGGPFGNFSDNVWLDHIMVVNNPVTGINDEASQHPQALRLEQNYPNPFNPSTTIQYGIPEKVKVSVIIYNAIGQKIKTLVSQNQEAGFYTVQWDGTNDNGQKLSSGIFMLSIKAGAYHAVKKMLMVK